VVFKYDLSPEKAIKTIQDTGRNPCEAIYYGNATKEELYMSHQQCRKDNIL